MGKSKKASKKGWKKVQHNDVEKFLDIAREKERHDFSSHTNESLFRIDTNGEAVVANNQTEALVDFDKLKCFQILKPDSNVRDPIVKRNKTKNTSRLQSKHKSTDATNTPNRKEETTLVDPWEGTASLAMEPEMSDWLRQDVLRVNSSIKKKRSAHKTSELSAISIPHPGFSVNPSFQDHQDLLKTALAVEIKEIRKEEKVNRAVQVPKTAITKAEQDKLEDFAGEKDDEDDIIEEEDEQERKPILIKPKTRQQRRKEKELKEREKAASDLKKIRSRESEVFKIKKIKKQLDKAEALQKVKLQAKLAKKAEHEKYGQKALSKHKYAEPKLNPLLSDEIAGRLVEVKTEGTADLLLDRFKSLQKRNILEVRKKNLSKRTNKLKKYVRPGDKMEWERTGVWNGIKIK